MTKEQEQIRNWMGLFGQESTRLGSEVSPETILLRQNLNSEEVKETHDALEELKDGVTLEGLTSLADGIGDSIFVLLGCAETFGIDIEPVIQEITRSNLSKMWTDEEVDSHEKSGNVDRYTYTNTGFPQDRCWVVRRGSDSKVIKSPSYYPANIRSIIQAQLEHLEMI